MREDQSQKILDALDHFQIETASWAFADTGTRFGKFLQDAAAISLDDKLADAAQVHRYTGCCPSCAVHVLWDFPAGEDPLMIVERAEKLGIRLGAVNPNLFQDQIYKYGSVCNRNDVARSAAKRHLLDSVEIAKKIRSKYLSLWFADGSNYPGQANIRWRKRAMTQCLTEIATTLNPDQVMLVEYKPFEPAFYHTDLADWGMAYVVAKEIGPRAKVLVDTGHHYLTQNIEQIVAWLLDEGMLGGFHFNDRRYADDDLTLGSIDPYQIFRIFHEIRMFEWETQTTAEIAYKVDQSHNLKGKIEAMIQTVCTAQELYARAALVDHGSLARLQQECSLVDAEETLRGAFWQDVRPAIQEWRKSRNLPADPMQAFRTSGYLERITRERGEKNRNATASYA